MSNVSGASHPAGEGRRTLPAVRGFLLLAGIFAFIAGVQTFVFPMSTDEHFAWTIQVPLSTVFLGAGYLGGAMLEFAGVRERSWARTRITLPVVWLFSTMTLVATLIHLDRFHHTSPVWNTALAAWVWIFLYVVVPPLLLALLIWQERQPGEDEPRRSPLPSWGRAALIASAAVLLVVGGLLFVAPAAMMPLWPWDLTPLTSRAVGTWLFAIGFALAHAAYENDYARVAAGAKAYTVFAALALVAVARFPADVHWDRPAAWLYLGFMVVAFLLGAYGWIASRRAAASG
jgi:hypothetical protein